MMPLEAVRNKIAAHLNTAVTTVQSVGGGDINRAARIETTSDIFFVKWNADSPPGMFTAEARGLKLLASAGALKVPDVILVSEAETQTPAFLVLEWMSPARPGHSTHFAEKFGEGLAALHQKTNALHGLDHDNFIGSLPQRNQQESRWIDFYRDHRIGAQAEIARQRGHLPAQREKLLDALCRNLPNLLPDVPPSLLHGDLWGGNYMTCENDTPVIYDPAVYYGHREVEMAFTELFDGFPARFYDAYNAVFPLDRDYQERKALYQLYPLMVHMNLFGGGYASQVDSIAARYI